MRRFRRRVNRRLYRLLFRVYRAAFPAPPAGHGRIPAASLSRILVVRHDRVGDMIVTTPALALLAELAPHAEIDVLASRANAQVVMTDSGVSRVFVRKGWSDWLLLFPAMRRRRYDVIYSFIYGRGLREGLIASAIARRETRKFSVMRPARYAGLFTAVIRAPRSLRHMADQLMFVVRATIESPDTRGDERHRMHIAVDAQAKRRAAAFVAEHGLSEFVAVNISSAEAWREWPWENCAKVLRVLLPRWPDLTFVLTPPPAAEKIRHAEQAIAACASDRVILCPPSPRFLDLVAVVQRASLVLTCDTANVHVASACGCPIIALYAGIRTTPGLWSPFGVPAREVRAAPGHAVSTIPAEEIVRACEELCAQIAQPWSVRV
ncbi:MAG: glycosyltransferase family 9 protein [Gemmatimonadaceae bacterium]